MKKITLILVAAVAMFTSCQNDENEVAKKIVTTFDASFEQPIAGDKNVKTLLADDGVSVNWQSGDKVTVVYVKNDDESQIQQVEFTATPKSDATKATLSTTTTIPEGYKAKYAVYSPNGLSNVTATSAQVTFKDSYSPTDYGEYPTNSFPSGANPAWGTIEGKTITFQNLAAIIVVPIYNHSASDAKVLQGIKITGDVNLAGLCTVSRISADNITYSSGNQNVLQYKKTRFLSMQKNYFYFAILPTTTTLSVECSAINKKSSSITFERNHIYYLPQLEY